mgnify:CR=1 FL=1
MHIATNVGRTCTHRRARSAVGRLHHRRMSRRMYWHTRSVMVAVDTSRYAPHVAHAIRDIKLESVRARARGSPV